MIRETLAGRLSFTEGPLNGEYHHLLSDMVNRLISAGFGLLGLWESPRPGLPGDSPATDVLNDPYRNWMERAFSGKLRKSGRVGGDSDLSKVAAL